MAARPAEIEVFGPVPFPAAQHERLALDDLRDFGGGMSKSPKMRHSVGQTLTHAGSSLFSTRFAQKLHFSAVRVFGSMKSWSYGHAAMHARQPMHESPFRSTMPSRRLKSAPVGQMFMQGASSH